MVFNTATILTFPFNTVEKAPPNNPLSGAFFYLLTILKLF